MRRPNFKRINTLVLATVVLTAAVDKSFAADPAWDNIQRTHDYAASVTATAAAAVGELPAKRAAFLSAMNGSHLEQRRIARETFLVFLQSLRGKLAAAEGAHTNAIRACEMYLLSRGQNPDVASLAARMKSARSTIEASREAVIKEARDAILKYGL